MSKHKKRKRPRSKRKRPPVSNARDKHHLCYQRKKWQRGPLRLLRDHWYCKVYVKRDTLHRKLHREMPDVPVPKNSSAKAALEQLEYLERYSAISEFDSLEHRLELLASLFDGTDQPTADAFRAQIRIVREFKASSK